MAVKKLLARIGCCPAPCAARLIAGLVALLAIACATVGLVTYFAVQGALYGELNNELQTATGLALQLLGTQATAHGQQRAHQAPGHAADNGGTGLRHPRSPGRTAPGRRRPAPTPPSPRPSASGSAANVMPTATGLGERTFVAVVCTASWDATLVSEGQLKLTAADEQRPAQHHAVRRRRPRARARPLLPTTRAT